MSTAETLSTWSNLGYVGAAVAVLLLDPGGGSAVVAVSLLLLAGGSWWMHGRQDYGLAETLDHAGMHATLMSLATLSVGAPWWLAAVGAGAAALVLERTLNVRVEPAMGVYLWFVGAGALVAGELTTFLLGLGCMGLGFAAWHREGDAWHAAWHVLTSVGLVFLYLAT